MLHTMSLQKNPTLLCLRDKPAPLIVCEVVSKAEGVEEERKMNRQRRKCSKKVMLMVMDSPLPSVAFRQISANWHNWRISSLFGYILEDFCFIWGDLYLYLVLVIQLFTGLQILWTLFLFLTDLSHL